MSDHIEEGSWNDFGHGGCPDFPESPKVQYVSGWLKLPGVPALKLPDSRDVFLRINPANAKMEIRLNELLLVSGSEREVKPIWNQMCVLVPLPQRHDDFSPSSASTGGWARSAREILQDLLDNDFDPDNDPT